MKTLILVLMLISSTVFAEGRVDPVPGGARADYHFFDQWEHMIKDQQFPMLTKETFKKNFEAKSVEAQPRYILHLSTANLQFSNVVWDQGYWYYQYDNAEQGSFWLAVHPKYKKCFDDAKKKFDLMQWVVFPWGEINGTQTLTVEYPRQCLGQLKDSGSKLPSAK